MNTTLFSTMFGTLCVGIEVSTGTTLYKEFFEKLQVAHSEAQRVAGEVRTHLTKKGFEGFTIKDATVEQQEYKTMVYVDLEVGEDRVEEAEALLRQMAEFDEMFERALEE